MARREDPNATRSVSTADLLENKVNLGGYQHRYLAVSARVPWGGMRSLMSVLLEAVELLEARSWELISIVDNNGLHAVMRSPTPPPSAQP